MIYLRPEKFNFNTYLGAADSVGGGGRGLALPEVLVILTLLRQWEEGIGA